MSKWSIPPSIGAAADEAFIKQPTMDTFCKNMFYQGFIYGPTKRMSHFRDNKYWKIGEIERKKYEYTLANKHSLQLDI